MSTQKEKALGEIIRNKLNADFYTTDKSSESARPSHAMLDPENPSVTNAFDFFMLVHEVLSGQPNGYILLMPEATPVPKASTQSPQELRNSLRFSNLPVYPPHGGGYWLDRVVAWYLGLAYGASCLILPTNSKETSTLKGTFYD